MATHRVITVCFKIGVEGKYFHVNSLPFVVGYAGCSEVINAYAVVLSQRNNNAPVVWQELGNPHYNGCIKAGLWEGDIDLFDEVAGRQKLT